MFERQSGSLLIELAIALIILALAIMGLFAVIYPNLQAEEMTDQRDEVRAAFENVSEVLRQDDFEQLYANRHGTSIPVPALQGPDGQAAVVQITCFTNENDLPVEFGPVFDLDGDPDSQSADTSGSYELLPIQLSLEYLEHGVVEQRELFLLIREKEKDPFGSP